MHLSMQMDTLLSIHRDFFTNVMDVAWEDLTLYEGKKWVCGKMQKVYLGSE